MLKKTIMKRHLFIVNSEDIDNRYSMLIEQISVKQCVDSYNEIFEVFAPKIYSYAMTNQMSDALAKDLV